MLRQIPSFSTAASSERPVCRRAAGNRRSLMVSLLSEYAVSRSDSISRQSSMGTMTAVGSPLSPLPPGTIWISVCAMLLVYSLKRNDGMPFRAATLRISPSSPPSSTSSISPPTLPGDLSSIRSVTANDVTAARAAPWPRSGNTPPTASWTLAKSFAPPAQCNSRKLPGLGSCRTLVYYLNVYQSWRNHCHAKNSGRRQ